MPTAAGHPVARRSAAASPAPASVTVPRPSRRRGARAGGAGSAAGRRTRATRLPRVDRQREQQPRLAEHRTPSMVTRAPPVSSSPMPTTVVPWLCSQTRVPRRRPRPAGSEPRARSANGSSTLGTNSDTASDDVGGEHQREAAHSTAPLRVPARPLRLEWRPSRPRRSGRSMWKPAAANARRTSGSRSMKMPAGEEPAAAPAGAGRSSRRELGGERHQQRGDEVGEHQVERAPARPAASPAGGHAPGDPLRRAFAAVASTAIGSVSTPSTARGPEPRGGDGEDARAAADIERARAGDQPASAHASIPARQRRVVGCRPVPNAMPGIERQDHVVRRSPVAPPRRADHQAPADAQHREVLLPRRRPVLLVHDRTCSSPMWRRPNACRWPSAVRTSDSARRAPRRVGARQVRAQGRGRAGVRAGAEPLVDQAGTAAPRTTPPGATRERISLTASTASASASTDSSSQVPPALRPSSRSAADRVLDACVAPRPLGDGVLDLAKRPSAAGHAGSSRRRLLVVGRQSSRSPDSVANSSSSSAGGR